MKKFWIKTVNIILIIGIIFGYNQIVLYRQKTEEVNSLQAKLKDASTMVKNVENKANAEQPLDNSTEDNSDNNGYKDGTYTGQAKGFGGQVIVDVAIAGGKIDSINIVSADKEDKAYFDMAKGVIEEMMENQSADVDAISGATFSSNGIINAVKQALEKAELR
jgi:uncharacterized protein with FMN-binding domain